MHFLKNYARKLLGKEKKQLLLCAEKRQLTVYIILIKAGERSGEQTKNLMNWFG